MGMQVSQDTLMKYVEQWTGFKRQPRETVTQLVGRVYDVNLNAKFPFGSFYAVKERCSFLEAVMLGRKRSHILSLLDQMDQTVLIGLEQSTAFAGKRSLFCAFRCDNPQQFGEKMSDLSGRASNKGHAVCANVQPNNEVLVAASFAVFIDLP